MPGRADAAVVAQLQRIGEGGVQAAPEHADRLEAGDGAHHHLAVLDDEVLAFEQHEAEIAGDIGVLEIGLVELARRQDADAAVGRARHGRCSASRKSRKKPASRWTCISRIDVGEGARRGDAVLQREAGARGRLRAVAQHPPAAVRAAAELEGAEMQEVAARRLDADQRAQEFGVAGDQLGRQQALRRPACCRRRCRRRRVSSRSARCIRPRGDAAPSRPRR